MAPPGSVSKLAMNEAEQGKRYADVAKAKGVKLFVWLVSLSLTPHHRADNSHCQVLRCRCEECLW